jgi:hypothetical protein
MSRSNSDNHSSRNTPSHKPSLRQRMSQDLQLRGMAQRTHDGYAGSRSSSATAACKRRSSICT